ncbi:MAG: hypothetical protein H0T53_16815 [Herpetosiphonaceae bacterium]|nr:hypothetical protein [Herpetosiphonaceae bacterium]
MSDADYPSFAHLFVRQPQWQTPLYIHLLRFNDNVVWTMSAIVQSLARSPSPAREICALLNGLDWREHLVGGVASILGQHQSAPVIAAVWAAFDEGSWVSPQLAVVASLIDPAFAEQARERILRRCQGVPDRTERESPLVRTVVSGPGGDYQRACKALAALVEATQHTPALRTWLEAEQQSAEIQQMLSDDPDGGAAIVRHWRRSCIQLCQECVQLLRQQLRPPKV